MPRKKNKQTGNGGFAPRKLPSGSWRIQYADPATGKRKSLTFPPDQYEEAKATALRLKSRALEIKSGLVLRREKTPRFCDFVDSTFIPNKTENKRRPSDDRYIFRKHLVPFFGDYQLEDINTGLVETFKAKLKKAGLADQTQANVLGLLSSVLRYAQELDLLDRLPTIKKPRFSQKDYSYLKTDADIRKFLNEAKKEQPGVYELFATAVYTGMRAGELFGLRWSNVDLKKRLITVQRSFDKPTKTGKVRHVPILDVLYPVLRNWRLKNKNELVFPNEVGNMHTPSPRVIKFTFKEILKKTKIKPMRFHDLRHTFASHWVMKNGDLFKLQKILGHADQKMVQRYAHLAPEAFNGILNIFGECPVSKTEIIKHPNMQKSGS